MTGKWGEIQGKLYLVPVRGEFELSEFELWGSGTEQGKTCLPFTSRFVNANDKQNLGLVNFVPESRVSFAQISSIYQKTAAKAYTKLNWYQSWL